MAPRVPGKTPPDEPPVTTVPSIKDLVGNVGKTTTTTTVPGGTTTTPTTTPKRTTTYRPDPSLVTPISSLVSQVGKTRRAGVPEETVTRIKEGEEPSRAVRVLTNVLDFAPIKYGVVKPLTTLDIGRRGLISATKEAMDLLPGGDKASFKDLYNQTKDVTFGYGTAFPNPFGTGTAAQRWGNRIVGLIGDIAFDPITYLSGPGGIAKTLTARAAAGTGKSAVRAGRLAKGLEEARIAAGKAAVEADALIRSGTATTAEINAAKQAVAVTKQGLDDAIKSAAGASTRRTYGAGAREAMAEQVRVIREEALQTARGVGVSRGEREAAARVAVALTDDVISDIATRGYTAIRGEVADALGVRGGLRFGVGAYKKTIPGTERLTNAFGEALTNIKFGSAAGKLPIVGDGLVKSDFGRKILEGITPVGEGGLFGSDDIKRMRTGLRGGTLTGKAGTDAVRLLAEDKAYRGFLQAQNKLVQGLLAPIINNKRYAPVINTVSEFLEAPRSAWTRVPTELEQELVDRFKEVADELYRQANDAHRALGATTDLPRVMNWFPHAPSQQALEFVQSSKRGAAEAAESLGVDKTFFRGNFVPRRLTPGATWFGKVLDADDVAGGVRRLNQIAREAVHLDGSINPNPIKFDFFTQDLGEALIRYGSKHAKDLAFKESIERMASAGDLMTFIPDRMTGSVKPSLVGINSLEATIRSVMTPDKLARWSPREIEIVRGKLDDLTTRVDTLGDIARNEFEEALLQTDEYIRAIDRGLPPGVPEMLTHEMEAYAISVADDVSRLKSIFTGTTPAQWKMAFKDLDSMVQQGFVALNDKIVPGIAARPAVAEMLQNVKRVADPAFAEATERFLKDYNAFFKGYATLSPGFHVRNAFGNGWALIVAGANPMNLRDGLSVSRKWNQYVLKKGIEPLRAGDAGAYIEDFISTLPAKQQEAARQAIQYTGAAGFGQVAEAFSGATAKRIGALGKETSSELSRKFGAPLRASRRLGGWIEDHSRFMLTFDGIRQGLDPQSAASRTSKFLINYEDLSSADRVLRQIIPFWMWASRNAPLQLENIWMNPRAYAVYNSVKRNFEDKEGNSPYLPEYLKEAGAFKLPGMSRLEGGAAGALAGGVVGGLLGGPFGAAGGALAGSGLGAAGLAGENIYAKPELGFPGAGAPGLIQELTEPKQLLSRLSPLLRVPLEVTAGEKFFSGAPIAAKDQDPQNAALLYALQQIATPVSTVSRLAGSIPFVGPALREQELYRQITGTRAPEEGAGGAETAKSLASYIGSPVFQVLPREERTEIWRRYYQLKALEDRKKAQKEKK